LTTAEHYFGLGCANPSAKHTTQTKPIQGRFRGVQYKRLPYKRERNGAKFYLGRRYSALIPLCISVPDPCVVGIIGEGSPTSGLWFHYSNPVSIHTHNVSCCLAILNSVLSHSYPPRVRQFDLHFTAFHYSPDSAFS
jgi:hypothetical protein